MSTSPGSKSVSWRELAEERCLEIVERGRWRRPRSFDALGPVGRLDAHLGNGQTPGSEEVVSFASNDYLGLSTHPAVVAAAQEALERHGTGSGASRYVTGSRPVHHDLEEALASWKHSERAMLFPSGYTANLGVLTSLGEAGVTIMSDAWNHASIVDGARLARAHKAVYPHGDMDALARLLSACRPPVIVVSDLVFSMDGDLAPVEELGRLCADHGALLVLDEAHGVLAPDPLSMLEGMEDLQVLRVGTMSKTLGALGGFVAGPGPLVDLIENRARSAIFTTALSPADAAAGLGALGVLHSTEGQSLVARLKSHVVALQGALEGAPHPSSVPPVPLSPIVPVVLGSEQRALDASAALLAKGMWVPAIRPPTVPEGSSRLRVTLSAAHSEEQVTWLAEALEELLAEPGRDGDAGRPGRDGEAGRPGVRGALDAPAPGVGRTGGSSSRAAERPGRLVVVAGTGTEVGKTWVSAHLARHWRQAGSSVAARKLAQSFSAGDGPCDAQVLGAATGEDPEVVCPRGRWYEVPMAPPMAAEALGLPVPGIGDLLGELSWGAGEERRASIGLLETAGGVRSPQAADGDVVDLVGMLKPDLVVLVADAGLGTINSVRLSAAALASAQRNTAAAGCLVPGAARRLVVVLNRFDPSDGLHLANLEWLSRMDGFDVHGVRGGPDGAGDLAVLAGEIRSRLRG